MNNICLELNNPFKHAKYDWKMINIHIGSKIRLKQMIALVKI